MLAFHQGDRKRVSLGKGIIYNPSKVEEFVQTEAMQNGVIGW